MSRILTSKLASRKIMIIMFKFLMIITLNSFLNIAIFLRQLMFVYVSKIILRCSIYITMIDHDLRFYYSLYLYMLLKLIVPWTVILIQIHLDNDDAPIKKSITFICSFECAAWPFFLLAILLLFSGFIGQKLFWLL